MSIKVIFSNGEMELVNGAVRWSMRTAELAGNQPAHLLLYSEEDNLVAEFREWAGVKVT